MGACVNVCVCVHVCECVCVVAAACWCCCWYRCMLSERVKHLLLSILVVTELDGYVPFSPLPGIPISSTTFGGVEGAVSVKQVMRDSLLLW